MASSAVMPWAACVKPIRPWRKPWPGGDPVLDAELLAKLRERYDEAVAFGITHNRHRDWHDGNHPGYTLGCWLRGYADQVWLFTREPGVE